MGVKGQQTGSRNAVAGFAALPDGTGGLVGDGAVAAASRTSAVSSAPMAESEKSAASVVGVDLKTVIALGVFRLRC